MALSDFSHEIPSEAFADSLRRAADYTWKEGLIIKGRNLCHGISGNGFSLLYHYHTSKDPKYLYYAARFAEFSLDSGVVAQLLEDSDDLVDQFCSLLTGELGHALFLSELLRAEQNNGCLFPGWSLFNFGSD